MRPTNGVDTFRNAFFDKLIEEETRKEQEEKLIKATCFHLYKIVGDTYESRGITYQHRSCSKCGHSLIKRREVWEGTKGCTIS